jgi:hypothetical protein
MSGIDFQHWRRQAVGEVGEANTVWGCLAQASVQLIRGLNRVPAARRDSPKYFVPASTSLATVLATLRTTHQQFLQAY